MQPNGTWLRGRKTCQEPFRSPGETNCASRSGCKAEQGQSHDRNARRLRGLELPAEVGHDGIAGPIEKRAVGIGRESVERICGLESQIGAAANGRRVKV